MDELPVDVDSALSIEHMFGHHGLMHGSDSTFSIARLHIAFEYIIASSLYPTFSKNGRHSFNVDID